MSHPVNQYEFAATVQSRHLSKATKPGLARVQVQTMVERLPFTISIAQTPAELERAVAIRHGAYARHVPGFAETLQEAESMDFDYGVAILLASSKVDGSPLGTMRIQTNRFKPLELEESLALPQWLATRRLAEAARLGVTNEKAGRLVKSMLFKAYFQYCQLNKVEWMVITARSPVDRQYDRLLFDDVYAGMGYVPLHHVDNIPHRVMKFEIGTAQARWAEASHPMYDFIFNTIHPDIDLRMNDFSTGRASASSQANHVAVPRVALRFSHA
ncbi:MAG: hypothetical protein JWR65_1870 [Massilia sp.]|nr:hypothetical protein [Massilia sp.]